MVFIFCAFFAASLLNGCSSADTQTYAWPLATASPEDTVTHLFAVKFAEEVEKLSNGTMRIEVYSNSSLGGDRDLLESCADGDIPFIVQNTAPQVTFMPDLAVFDLPCVFSNLNEMRETIDGEDFSASISQVYTDGGYHLLGIADQGFRVMTANKPIQSLADFKGVKIRTMENPYHLSFWSALGSSPTPMSFSEVYIGLQQHTIDAQENSYDNIVSSRLFEQQDYVIETNHLPHLITLIVNDSFYQAMNDEQKAIIDEAASLATIYGREMSDERVAQKTEQIRESGTQFISLDESVCQEMRTASEKLYETIQSSIQTEIYNAYVSR